MKEINKEARPAAIKFSDASQGQAYGETAGQMRNRLRRTNSTASQAIIAYRTLSITVSENQTKAGGKRTKKSSKDVVDGKKYKKEKRKSKL